MSPWESATDGEGGDDLGVVEGHDVEEERRSQGAGLSHPPPSLERLGCGVVVGGNDWGEDMGRGEGSRGVKKPVLRGGRAPNPHPLTLLGLAGGVRVL